MWMLFSSKKDHDFIFLAAARVARMLTCLCLGREQRVSRWQWSGLSWEMMIRSMGCLRSARELMCGASVCLVYWKVGCRMELPPESHGSMRIVNAPGNR